MSNALAISGVTAVLQYFLNIVYNDPSSPLGNVLVSAIAPDIVQANIGSGGNSQLQVNVFLHQVTPNGAWRNVDLPSAAADGKTRLKNPPLALDLHYLLTAYASEDTQAEALLGYALLMLHENPVLPRGQINTALTNLPSTNPLAGALSSSGLADQIEMLKVTPATLGREEVAWLWTALKSDFRPTFAFDVSVVLMQSPLASSFALPVLSRNISADSGGPSQLFAIQVPMGQTAPAPGDTVTVTGESLTGASQIALTNQRLGIRYPPFAPSAVTDQSVSFVVPEAPANLPAGVYSLSVLFASGGGQVLRSTNSLPVALAPKILAAPPPAAVTNASGTLVTLNCDPQALPNQSVSLAMGGTAAPAKTFDAPAATLSFQFPTLPAGSYLARLRVDGVDSPVAVNWAANPPTFAGPFITV
jgi:Pvc16 N-terminal domain